MASERRGLRARLGLDTEEGRLSWDDRLAAVVGLVAATILVATLIGAVLMAVQLYRHGQLEEFGNPIVPIFSSRLMIMGARLAILFIGVYIALSILMHMRRGQWLTAAGPLRVSESVRTLSARLAAVREQASRLLKENRRLKTTVSELTRELRTTEALLQEAQKRLRESEERPAR